MDDLNRQQTERIGQPQLVEINKLLELHHNEIAMRFTVAARFGSLATTLKYYIRFNFFLA